LKQEKNSKWVRGRQAQPSRTCALCKRQAFSLAVAVRERRIEEHLASGPIAALFAGVRAEAVGVDI
jgi:hypothetical protein